MRCMRNIAAPIAAILAPALLAACAVLPEPDTTPPAPQGSAVALGQSVKVGEVTVTPQSVVEDSRCPTNARCVWAGRLVVRTQVDGAGWRDSGDIRLGETWGTHGRAVALVSAEPAKQTDHQTQPAQYRFIYEAR